MKTKKIPSFFFHNYSQNFIDKLLSEKYFSGNLLLRIEKLLVLISESPSVWALATRLCRCPALGISEEIITENGRLKEGFSWETTNKRLPQTDKLRRITVLLTPWELINSEHQNLVKTGQDHQHTRTSTGCTSSRTSVTCSALCTGYRNIRTEGKARSIWANSQGAASCCSN